MPGKVADASVVAAMAFEEPNASEAAALVEGSDLTAPTILHHELASVAGSPLPNLPPWGEGTMALVHSTPACGR